MGQETLISFIESLQDAFLSGRVDELRSMHTLPVVIYSVAGVTVLRNRSEFQETVEQYRAALIALGVEKSRIDVYEQDGPLNNRLRVTVRTTDLDASDREVTSSLIRYFLIETADGYRIEMIEYLEAPLPPDEVERIVH